MSNKLYSVVTVIILIINKTNGLSNVCGEGLKCISKCCPDQYYISDEECVEDDNATDVQIFSEVLVYNDYLESTGKNLYDVFGFFERKPNSSLQPLHTEQLTLNDDEMKPYLLEDGKLYLECIISNNGGDPSMMVESENFCVHYSKYGNNEYEVLFRITMTTSDDPIKTHLNTTAFIVSSTFLLLTLVVYLSFSALRTLAGKIIMSLAASLLGSYVSLLVLTIVVHGYQTVRPDFCYIINFVQYFFLLASFFWMNVLSFDIWNNVRSMRPRSCKNERGEYQKFIVYSTYGWGIPLIMAVIVTCIELDYIDVTSMPYFVKPNIKINGCFFGNKARLYYIYLPMLVLILCNWYFFFVTAFLIWKTKLSGQNAGIASTPNSIKARLKIFLKLSLVTGISWVLEVVSAYYKSPIWHATDVFNILIGLAIFIITVCNKKVYILVKNRFGKGGTFFTKSVKSSSVYNTQESILFDSRSNEMELQLINENPKGNSKSS